MDNWQVEHITKNLTTLIRATKPSALLKAGLKAKELLTDEEDEGLTASGQNKGSINEAKMLYEIMMTRPTGYNGLMEVLRDTRQDGAFKILQDGLQRADLQVKNTQTNRQHQQLQTWLEYFSLKFRSVLGLSVGPSQPASTDLATELMNISFQLSQGTRSFNDVFPHFKREDALELLSNADLTPELEGMVRTRSMEIKLEDKLPVTPDLYIPRLLSNRLQLNPQVFSLDSCDDVFVFTNISRMELAHLVKPNAVRSSTGQRSLVTGRHIYLDDGEDWDDMVAISPQCPIHLVSKEDNGYILQRTTKVTDTIQNYLLREGRSTEAFVTEDEFVEELVAGHHSKGTLICDVAGMGKTWLMQSLASKIRAKSESLVVFYIDLPSFSKLLTAKDDKPTENQALAIILNYSCNSKLANHLLQKYAQQSALKIVFVLDGYDEINSDDIENVKSNLEILSKLEYIRMIISSRPIMRAFLQESFNLISFDILPFQTDEQVRCLTEHWRNVCPQIDSKSGKLEEFALQCIKSVKSIQNDDIHDFLGVPLKCRILATVNEQHVKQICKATRKKPLQIAENATIKSVFDLYTMFVDALVDKIASEIPQNHRNDFAKGILTFYTHMALELLFPDLSNVYLKNNEIDSSMEEFFRRVGVACFNNFNQRLEFIHRSFAEYFVGRFFAEFWNDIDQFSPSFAQMVGSYFIRNVMIAVDGAFKIHSDLFKQRITWEDLVRDVLWRDGDFSSFLGTRKVFQLKYPLIILFMNMNLNALKLKVKGLERSTKTFRNVAMSFETEAINTTQSLQPVNTNYWHELCGLKEWLSKSSFATIIACIDERLTNILSLYVQLLISFFAPEDRVALLLPNAKYKNKESTERAAWHLCRAATSKSPENAVALFNLFGDSEENFFTVLCQRYPEEYWSPLEVAIITEDVDMVLYFVDKVRLTFYRLFFSCVAVERRKKLAEPDYDAKLKIIKMVLGSSDRVLNSLCVGSLCSYRVPYGVNITKYSFQLLLKFLEDSKHSISSIKSENKTFVLEKCLEDCNDEELVNLLLTLYGKSDDNKFLIAYLPTGLNLTADEVLDALDLVEIRKAFSKVDLSRFAFRNCWNLETLKVLTAIQPDFSCCNYKKWNYLHVAAFQLNIDWVKHLINSGYEVDQLDIFSSTPLLCASKRSDDRKSLLAATRFLIENGANLYAKDKFGQNVAHCVFNNCWSFDSKDLSEWVSYMLDNGYHQLWEMRDWKGKTPQEILFNKAGKNSPMTTDILRIVYHVPFAI